MSQFFERPSLRILAMATAVTWFTGFLSPATWSLIAVLTCWLVFFSYSWYRLIKAGHFWIASLPILFLIIIGFGVALPAPVIGLFLQPINELLSLMNCPLTAGKVGHVFCFAMLTLFALRIRHQLGIRAKELVAFITLLAIATEGIQLFVAIRTASLRDVGLDLFGALIGFGLFAFYKLFRKQPKRSLAPQTSGFHLSR